jgi:hypothetical protein
MSTRPARGVLGARFAAAAVSEISLATAATFDPGLPRDPRLLVPVDVRALVVAPDETVEHADVETKILTAAQAGETEPRRQAPPFSDAAPRSPGVYLHWALPDGLTQGHATETDDLELHVVPDRWLIVRIEAGRRRRTVAWVIEAERGRAVPLSDWSEQPDVAEGRTPTFPPESLTAVAGGDPAWAAVWDNVEDRFGFHDDLDGLGEGAVPLSYLVVGWYSVPELDPLHPAPERPAFEDLLGELGWSVDRVRLEQLRAEIGRRNEAARIALKVEPRMLDLSGPRALLDPRSPRETAPLTSIPPRLIAGAGELVLKVPPWAPTQSLYHGAIHGVRVLADARRDPKPDASSVRIAVGGTGTESLAALIANGLPGDPEVAERLQTAFGYGIVDAFEEVDALPRIEEEIHQRGFGSEPGGSRDERVRAGDALAELRGAGGAEPESIGPVAGAGAAVRFEFGSGRYAEVLDRFVLQTRPERVAPPPDPLHFETVQRGLPRFYFPQDPVLTLQGLNRSLRHGYDGRFEPDETVACRLSGDPVSGYDGLLDGDDLLEEGIRHGGVPMEAQELLREAVVEDPFSTEEIAAAGAARSGLPEQAVRARIEAESKLLLRTWQPESDAIRLAAASLKRGVFASPVAVTPYAQAWVPLYAEWELELAVNTSLDRWRLDELDLEPVGPAASSSPSRISGRSLLTSSGAKAFADQVGVFIEEERRLDLNDRGRIDDETASLLRTTAREARWVDTVSAMFQDLREHMLGFDTDVGHAEEGADLPPPAPSRPPLLLRGGTARLTRLRIVDAFGRYVEVPPDGLRTLVVSASMRTPEEATSEGTLPELLLPPRLTAPSRLLLRLLDAEDDAAEASLDQEAEAATRSPVAAWLLPDHIDGALEVFDATGDPRGQLRHESLAGGVVWEGAPGRPEAVGSPPPADLNRHAAAFAVALVRRDAADRAAGLTRDESPLSALLRVVDTTLWTVDPFGHAGPEYVALVVGRPIALVRAEFRLEVRSDAEDYPQLDGSARAERAEAFRALSDRAFEVRLGALTRFEDGLLGYFVDDDYSRFFPVHARVPLEALPSGPRTGFLGTPEEATAMHVELPAKPISHPYVEPDPTVSIRPGQTVRLTLLLDPGSKVHVTAGFVPRKSIALLRDWTSSALARIAPSFRIGPVLVDPETIRLPKPSALPKDQVWTRRDTPTSWRDDPILAATQDALLPETAALVEEGYVRVWIEPPPVD